ncbi:MAG TPA: hypothetical protein VFJ24_06125, partial [Gaiellales bacterium]|nr:hypothetical protein [Gaiellales bacterium]
MTRDQLLALGLGAKAIAYRARIGRLHRVHLGIYAVGRRPVTPTERASAAVLACGPGAVLSHRSAAALWGLLKRWEAPLEVTTTKDRRPKGIKVHRTTTLHRDEITRHVGIPVTTPARTILDIAPALNAALIRTVNDALLSPYLTRETLAAVIRAHTRCPGARLLEPFITTTDGPTRSGFDDDFLRFCRRFGLPIPRI